MCPPLLTGLQLNDMQMGGTLSVKRDLIPLSLPASQAALAGPLLAGRQLGGANGWCWETVPVAWKPRFAQGPQVTPGLTGAAQTWFCLRFHTPGAWSLLRIWGSVDKGDLE